MDTVKKSSPGKEHVLHVKKLALIGAGKLGEALLSGILSSQLVPASRVEATVAHQPRADALKEKYGIKAHTENSKAVAGADLVVIAAPMGAYKAIAAVVGPALAPGAIVTDVGSVKGVLAATASQFSYSQKLVFIEMFPNI